MPLSEKLDLKLIQLVKENSALYDYAHPKYMDFNAREVAWHKIGDELKRSAADCKTRWVHIRDVHRRIIRKCLSGGPRPKRAYKYDKQMEFMKKFYKELHPFPTNVNTNMDESEGEMDKTSDWQDVVIEYLDSEEEEVKPLKKRKKSPKQKKKSSFEEIDVPSTANDTSVAEFDTTDPVDSFLISIGTTLKRFSPYHLNLAKSKIFHIVQEHDLQQIVERQQGRSDTNETVPTEAIYFQG